MKTALTSQHWELFDQGQGHILFKGKQNVTLKVKDQSHRSLIYLHEFCWNFTFSLLDSIFRIFSSPVGSLYQIHV